MSAIRDEYDPDWGRDTPDDDKHNSVNAALGESRADYGDEGKGYSIAIMVEELEKAGWIFEANNGDY